MTAFKRKLFTPWNPMETQKLAYPIRRVGYASGLRTITWVRIGPKARLLVQNSTPNLQHPVISRIPFWSSNERCKAGKLFTRCAQFRLRESQCQAVRFWKSCPPQTVSHPGAEPKPPSVWIETVSHQQSRWQPGRIADRTKQIVSSPPMRDSMGGERRERKVVAGPGIEPGTRGFSIRCSTN